MTVTAEQLVVDLLARTDKLEREMRGAVSRFDRNLGQMQARGKAGATDIERSFNRIGSAAGALKGALAGLLAGASIGALAQLADEAKGIASQLKLATNESGSFAQATADVKKIADETRNGLSATSTLYGNFVRSSRDLGKGQADAARATETFSKALKIGGADTAAATSATLQFGQALASGVLRGDEFNSIAEASPRILQLLAEALGVSRGQIRGMAEDGKLTSDVLFRALTERKFTEGVDNEFKLLPVTFGEATQKIHDSAVIAFGAFDRGGQFSTTIANFALDGAGKFGDLEKSAENFGIIARATIEGLASAFNPMTEAGSQAFEFISGKFRGLRDEIAEVLGAVDSVRNFGRDVPGLINEDSGVIGRALAPYMKKAPASDLKGSFEKGYDKRARIGRVDAAVADFNAKFGAFDPDDIYLRPPATPKRAAASSAARKGSGGRKAGAATKAPTLADRLKAESEGSGSFISADLAAAGSDANALTATLGSVDRALASVRTGIEGVDVGTILTEQEARRLEQFSDDFRRDLSGGLADAVVYGQNLGDVLENSFKRAAAAYLESGLADLFAGKGLSGFKIEGAGGGGGIGNILGSIGSVLGGGGSGPTFGGGSQGNPAGVLSFFGRASGGYVAPGQTVRINEAASPGRVEGFRPQGSGTIIPLGRMAMSSAHNVTVHQHFSIDMKNTITTPQLMGQLQSYVNEKAGQAYSSAVRDAGRKAPTALARADRLGTVE